MAKIVIIYDPEGRGVDISPANYPPDWSMAGMDVADDLSSIDLYEVARKVAELMLEQVARRNA